MTRWPTNRYPERNRPLSNRPTYPKFTEKDELFFIIKSDNQLDLKDYQETFKLELFRRRLPGRVLLSTLLLL